MPPPAKRARGGPSQSEKGRAGEAVGKFVTPAQAAGAQSRGTVRDVQTWARTEEGATPMECLEADSPVRSEDVNIRCRIVHRLAATSTDQQVCAE